MRGFPEPPAPANIWPSSARGSTAIMASAGTICAQDIIAEIGTNMTVFPTASHLVSWARWSLQVKQSAGKTQRQERNRPRQPLPVRRRRRSLDQRRPHPVVPRRQVPAADQAHAEKEGPGRQLHAHQRPRPARRTLTPPTPTLAPTTTNSACTRVSRPATTSEASKASATKSPSRHSALTPPNP